MESREDVSAMLEDSHLVDLVVPRGSNDFVQHVMKYSKAPVLGHADGVCHLYVQASAKIDQAVEVVIDSKCDYPSACNALECLLLDEEIAKDFLKKLAVQAREKELELKLCQKSRHLLPDFSDAEDSDFGREFGELTMAVKIVESLPEALDHIAKYSSRHTDGILCEDDEIAKKFIESVDSASVFHNLSTRFADGFRYGLGAEIGISTNKTHARGPVGLEGLVLYKYVLRGNMNLVKNFKEPLELA